MVHHRETIKDIGNWHITQVNLPNGRISITVENVKKLFIDYPIFYRHNRQVAFTFPERIPKSVKNFVQNYLRGQEDARNILDQDTEDQDRRRGLYGPEYPGKNFT
jgi:hypothetical protein